MFVFRSISRGNIISRIYINYVKCFCVLNDKICTFRTWNIDVFPEALFQLLFYIIIFQKWSRFIVELHNIFSFWRDDFDVIFHVFYHLLIITNNRHEICIKIIPQDGGSFIFFTQNFAWNFVFLNIFKSIFPLLNQLIHIIMKFSYFFSFCNGSNNYAETFRFNAFDERS